MLGNRLKKYYSAAKANKPFLKTSLLQKEKILFNIAQFFKGSRRALILKNKPVTAQIEPTSKCNLKCEMCVREKIGVPIGTLSFENFKIILTKLDCLFKIHLSGQGEPFLNPEIFKMIDYANKRGILVNTTTNGTLLNKQIIESICKVELGEISVSLDSTKQKVYEKIRKGANFDKVIANIKNLTSELEMKKKKTIVTFAIVLLKENFEEVTDFIKLANKIGVKKVIFQTIQNKEDYVKNYDENIKKQTVADLMCKVKEKMSEAMKLGEKYKIIVVFDEGKPSEGCVWPWRGIYASWNGFITPCCKILDYRKPIIGNIIKDDFWKIWNGNEYQMYRKMLMERKAPAACRGCWSGNFLSFN